MAEDTVRYYNPDPEDIRIGYECEVVFDKHGNWCKHLPVVDSYGVANIIEELQNPTGKDGTPEIRTKYLSKECIEELGWKYLPEQDTTAGTTIGRTFTKESSTTDKYAWYLFIVQTEGHVSYDVWIYEDLAYENNVEENMETRSTRFDGKCKSKNELSYIMKLLGIK